MAANWTFLAGSYPRDTQSRSKEFDYTTVGAPQPPVLKALRTELLNQVTVEWTSSRANSIPVAGYKVLLNGTSDFKINGKPASEPLPADCNTTTIDHLAPGRTVKVRSLSCHSIVLCGDICTIFKVSHSLFGWYGCLNMCGLTILQSQQLISMTELLLHHTDSP